MGGCDGDDDEAELGGGFSADGFEARDVGFFIEPGVAAGVAFDGAETIEGEGIGDGGVGFQRRLCER